MSAYSTRTEAIQREIIDPIEASPDVIDARAEYDVDAIADEVIVSVALNSDGVPVRYAPIVYLLADLDPDDFWEIVAENETTN